MIYIQLWMREALIPIPKWVLLAQSISKNYTLITIQKIVKKSKSNNLDLLNLV